MTGSPMSSSSDRPAAASPPALRRQVDGDAALLAARFADALTAGDGHRAEAIALEARSSGLSIAAVHGRVITPAMNIIGDLWERGEISVAEEHLATVICHRVLAALHGTIRGLPGIARGNVLLATPAGQRHALGLRMVADVLEAAGYAVTHLGADVPADALRHAVRRYEPDALGLSLTMPEGVASLEEAIDAAREVRPDLPILLGGRAVPADLLGAGIHQAQDIESVAAALEQMLDRDEAARRPAPPARASRPRTPALKVAAAPEPRSLAEQLAREAEEIGEVAREYARLADRFRALAFEDELCELPNRRAFDDRFRELSETHGRPGEPPLMVLLLDLDGLKAINDELGHDAGDVALRMIAGALRTQLREQDLPARLGGDEFGALLPGADPAQGVEIAERVCRAIREGFVGDPPPITASCGVARFDGDRRRTMIRADQSLYEAKRAGRDRVLLAT